MKNDPRSCKRNLCNCERSLKKIQDFNKISRPQYSIKYSIPLNKRCIAMSRVQIELKPWFFFGLLSQLHKLRSELRGLFFIWLFCDLLILSLPYHEIVLQIFKNSLWPAFYNYPFFIPRPQSVINNSSYFKTDQLKYAFMSVNYSRRTRRASPVSLVCHMTWKNVKRNQLSTLRSELHIILRNA